MKYFCIIGTYVSLIMMKHTEEFFNQNNHILLYRYYIILLYITKRKIYKSILTKSNKRSELGINN